MAEIKKRITQLDPALGPLDGTEVSPVVQGGVTKKIAESTKYGTGWWEKLKAGFTAFKAPDSDHADNADTLGAGLEEPSDFHDAAQLTGVLDLDRIPVALTGKNASTADYATAAGGFGSNAINWIRAELVGSGLNITGVDFPALAPLNGTDVAFIDSVNKQLCTYRWSGSAWSQVGSGLDISGGVGEAALAPLNGTDVAFIDRDNKQLRTYRWSGSAWSQVGGGLDISGGVGTPALAPLNGTDVAFIDSANDQLRTYRWSGSAWSLVGGGLDIAGVGYPTLASLNGTDVAFIDSGNDQLRTYRFAFSLAEPYIHTDIL